MEPKEKKRDWRKECLKSRERQAKINAKLRKTLERKRKRKPHEWKFEELSNPDHQWLEFLRDIQEVLGREPDAKEKKRIGKYLKISYKYKKRPEPLRSHERKKLREIIRDWMVRNGVVPDGFRLKSMYNSVKGKTKKELWK